MILNITLNTEESIKKKHSKTWITINLVYNIDKSYKLKFWYIRKVFMFDILASHLLILRIIE